MDFGGLIKEFRNIFNGIEGKVDTLNSSIESKDKEISFLRLELSNLKASNTTLIKEFTDYKKTSEGALIDLKVNINDNINKKLQNIQLQQKEFKNDLSKQVVELDEQEKSLKLYINSLDKNKELYAELNIVKEDTKKEIADVINSINSVLSKVKALPSIENSIAKLEESFNNHDSFILDIKNTNKDIESIRNSKYKAFKNLGDTLKEEIKFLKETLYSFKLNKKDILKTLQDKGSIDLLYNLKITPRILPKTGKEGEVVLDAKDGKLKYWFNKEWIIL